MAESTTGSTQPAQRAANVLVIEDNEDHSDLLEFAIEKSGFHVELHLVTDGEQAMQFLRREAPFDSAPQPDFIFLDINLPRIDGRQVLAEVKNDATLKTIPVIVLSTSDSPLDRTYCYENHANAFLAKPLLLEDWQQLARDSLSFWLNQVWLPQ